MRWWAPQRQEQPVAAVGATAVHLDGPGPASDPALLPTKQGPQPETRTFIFPTAGDLVLPSRGPPASFRAALSPPVAPVVLRPRAADRKGTIKSGKLLSSQVFIML